MTIQNAFRKICKVLFHIIYTLAILLGFGFGTGLYFGFFIASLKIGWDVGQEFCYKFVLSFLV